LTRRNGESASLSFGHSAPFFEAFAMLKSICDSLTDQQRFWAVIRDFFLERAPPAPVFITFGIDVPGDARAWALFGEVKRPNFSRTSSTLSAAGSRGSSDAISAPANALDGSAGGSGGSGASRIISGLQAVYDVFGHVHFDFHLKLRILMILGIVSFVLKFLPIPCAAGLALTLFILLRGLKVLQSGVTAVAHSASAASRWFADYFCWHD
jgi:hypothetical protein